VHVADDGDVARVFEFVAGVAAVGELTGVPLVTGSTLRIGGDLVLGERLTGCVGAVGETARLTPRRALEAGDLLLMTEGGGGGTITAAAIYGGFPEVVEETLNVQLLDACADLAARPEWGSVHAMTDVTNGGLRGDAHEMAATTGLGIVVDRGLAAGLVRPAVARMLDSLRIDPLGVSLDALLVAAPPRVIDALGRALTEIGVRSEVIGEVRAEPGVRQRIDGEEREFAPRFRESAYTPVKKVVGEAAPEDLDELARRVTEAAEHAKQRKAEVVRTVAARRTRATQ
jgi:hydrogenase expression/formation protein